MADAMTPGPFPSELVEAAEAAIIAADKQASPVGDPNVMLASEEAQARAVLAAVLPRIEQRVIDRLAREAARASMTDPFPNTPRNEESDVDKRKRRRAVEIVVAWSCMAVMVAATVAAVWLAVGPVAGLFALAAYAAVTGYHAHAGTLIDWGER